MPTINITEFEEIFGGMTPRLAEMIERFNLVYVPADPRERDACIKRCVEAIIGADTEVVGDERLSKWEWGWGLNLNALERGDPDALLPHYFKNDKMVRWRQQFIKPTKPGFDYAVLTIILQYLIETYMQETEAIYEFGCGTGHHLPQVRAVNKTAKIVGLDWAENSQKIIALMVERGMIENVEGRRFDFFNPDDTFQLSPGAVVYTTGALEQVGARHHAFVEYLLEKKPRLCVHVEPIAEVLSANNLLDYLAIEYFERRKYLSGFLTHLRALEAQGRARVHDVRRTWCGGNVFVDHYTIVVWSPL